MDPPAHTGSHRCQALDPVQRTVSHRIATTEPVARLPDRHLRRPDPSRSGLGASTSPHAAWRSRPINSKCATIRTRRSSRRWPWRPTRSSFVQRTLTRRSTSTWKLRSGPPRKLARLWSKRTSRFPAGIRVFKFASLDKKDVTVKQGEVSVTLKDTEVDEQVWKVNVELAYPGEGPVFDSYRQGLFNNRLWLQRADGSRFEHNGGFSNTEQRRRQARLRIPVRGCSR